MDVAAEVQVDVQISHTAHIDLGDGGGVVTLYTYYFGGTWKWAGALLNTVGHDDLDCRVYDYVERVNSGLSFFDNSEDAIAHAVANFDGTEDDGPEDDYPGEVLPTGWDAQDHKALYE